MCLCLRVRIAYHVMYEAGIGNVNTDLLIFFILFKYLSKRFMFGGIVGNYAIC